MLMSCHPSMPGANRDVSVCDRSRSGVLLVAACFSAPSDLIQLQPQSDMGGNVESARTGHCSVALAGAICELWRAPE